MSQVEITEEPAGQVAVGEQTMVWLVRLLVSSMVIDMEQE